MSFNSARPGTGPGQGDVQTRSEPSTAAASEAPGFGQLLQSMRQSINRNMEPFSEGLHKVVDGNTDKDAEYETGSESSSAEVDLTVGIAYTHASSSDRPRMH